MPPKCSVCSHDDLAAINKAVAVHRESQRSVAKRYSFTQAAVNRHSRNCLGIASTKEEPAKERADSDASELKRIGPSDTAQTQMTREQRFAYAVRLLSEALDVLEQSKREKDRATALKALKEARDCLALVMRAEGDLTDGAGNAIDARSVNVFAGWNPDELRALIKALPASE